MAGGRRLRKKGSGNGSRRHRKIENCAIKFLLCMALSWIVGFILVLFGYIASNNRSSSRLTHFSSGSLFGTTVRNNLPRLPIANKPNIHPTSSSGTGNGVVGSGSGITGGREKYESPLLIFTCSRATYLRETLKDIYEYLPRTNNDCKIGCPIIISQDGTNPQVLQVIKQYQEKFSKEYNIPLYHIQHIEQPIQGGGLRGRSGSSPYEALARHYKWALTKLFDGSVYNTNKGTGVPLPQRVIILEEDLHISPDFFSYMYATSKILDEDDTLLSVSAFNDNGHICSDGSNSNGCDPKRLLRSDFFPGLGWLLTRKLWMNELQIKWPNGYWDDWLREPIQRQNRQIIRPEISRTYHFGSKGGASNNQFGSILSNVILNKENINWMNQDSDYDDPDLDLSFLKNEEYRTKYGQLVYNAKHASNLNDALEQVRFDNVRIEYQNYNHFKKLADKLQIMDDEKAMIPRTSYNGIVETRPTINNNANDAAVDGNNNHRILFLTPPIQQLSKDFPIFAQQQ